MDLQRHFHFIAAAALFHDDQMLPSISFFFSSLLPTTFTRDPSVRTVFRLNPHVSCCPQILFLCICKASQASILLLWNDGSMWGFPTLESWTAICRLR